MASRYRREKVRQVPRPVLPEHSPRAQVPAATSLPQSNSAAAMKPVTAKDVDRLRNKRILAGVSVGLVLAFLGVVVYHRIFDPIRAREAYESARRLYEVGRYAQAGLALDRAIALKPAFLEALILRGQTRTAIGKPLEALEDYSAAIRADPSNTQARLLRAAAYLDAKNSKAALEDCTQALAVSPNLARAHSLRGIIIRDSGDPRGALADFDEAVRLAPVLPNYFERAMTYQALGDHRSAIADFDRALAISDLEAVVYFTRARSREALGDLAGAKRDRIEGRVLGGMPRPKE
jgi:tetratricopeptide (TPR) repeat protein